MNPRSPSLAAHKERRRKALAIKKVKRGREKGEKKEKRTGGLRQCSSQSVVSGEHDRLRALDLSDSRRRSLLQWLLQPPLPGSLQILLLLIIINIFNFTYPRLSRKHCELNCADGIYMLIADVCRDPGRCETRKIY